MQGTKTLLAAASALFMLFALVSCGGGVDGDSGRVVNVTGVTMNKITLELGVGEDERLVAMVVPSNATNQSVAWSSDNKGVASVENGRVTGVGAGQARVEATTENGGHRAHCDVYVRNIPVTGVSLDKTSIVLAQGGVEVLLASVQPNNATNKNVSWSSSNLSIAMVSAGGIVTGVSSGNAIITVTTQDGGRTAVCAVQVAAVPVASVSLIKTLLTLSHGDSETLVAIVQPENATNKNVSWSSSNPSIAAVSQGGIVTGVAPGSAAITVTTQDGGKTAVCAVTVIAVPVVGVSLDRTSLVLSHGDSEVLAATVQPENATNKNVSWSSSNAGAASVNGGLVTAVSPGGAVITVTTQDGGRTATCAVQVNAVPVTGVSLNKTSIALAHGDSETLVATVLPGNATDKSVSWSSSNAGVASVDGGLVTAVSPGGATITVTTQDGGWAATCAVQVNAVPVTGVTLNKTSLTLAIPSGETLIATVLPSNATDKSVSWSSSNPNIAPVSSVGHVTGVAEGSAVITVTTHDGGKTATCAVQVEVVRVTGVTLDKASLVLAVADSETLVATVQPSNATNQGVSWSSSNAGVAAVNGGLVTGVLAGTATITVTTADGNITATCAVTVMGTGDVYVVGNERNASNSERATLWKNGVIQGLSEVRSNANSVFVSGDDVYVAGYEAETSSSNSLRATLWKNGVAQRLSNQNNGNSYAHSVFVSGDDVYVVGYEAETSSESSFRATLWKNGAIQGLSEVRSIADSVFVSGNDVYIAGYEHAYPYTHATLWTNGVAQRLSKWDEGGSYAYSVFVSGDDVYVAGYGGYPTAKVWKNGVDLGVGGPYSSARTVFVSGGDVYAAGRGSGDVGAILWKNGFPQQLGYSSSRADSVFVFGNDVYVAGYEHEGTSYDHATLWKNGIAQRLSNSNSHSYAYSVFVK
jgi:uncharacterized protein YjdB